MVDDIKKYSCQFEGCSKTFEFNGHPPICVKCNKILCAEHRNSDLVHINLTPDELSRMRNVIGNLTFAYFCPDHFSGTK